MKTNLGNFFIIFGLLALVHSAYSAAQHRSYLRLAERDFDYLPVDIVVQTVLSLLVTISGVTLVAGEFKEIRATNELQNKSFEDLGRSSSFYTFSHRGRVLSSVYSQ